MELIAELSVDGWIDPNALSAKLGITPHELAIAIGLPETTFTEGESGDAPHEQEQLRRLLEILGRVYDWAGGMDASWSWYQKQPIPALGGSTAQELVAANRTIEVWGYLDQIEMAGYT